MANRVLVLTGPNLKLPATCGHELYDAATRISARASLCRLIDHLAARYADKNADFRREPFRLAQFAASAATGISWRA